MEKGLPLKSFFSKKKYNPRVYQRNKIFDKAGGLKLALLCICPHSHAGVAISGISLHYAMHFPSYEFSIAILAYSISLPGFDVVYFVFVLRKKAMFYYFF